jgi:hypothetical protein
MINYKRVRVHIETISYHMTTDENDKDKFLKDNFIIDERYKNDIYCM